MRKVTFGGASSLDSHFARKDDAVDWLLWSDEAMSVMASYWKTIDTILMGRKTYEVAPQTEQREAQSLSGHQDLRVLAHLETTQRRSSVAD